MAKFSLLGDVARDADGARILWRIISPRNPESRDLAYYDRRDARGELANDLALALAAKASAAGDWDAVDAAPEEAARLIAEADRDPAESFTLNHETGAYTLRRDLES